MCNEVYGFPFGVKIRLRLWGVTCRARNRGDLRTGLVGSGMILPSYSIGGGVLRGSLFGIRCGFVLRFGYLWGRVGCWCMVYFDVEFGEKVSLGVVFIVFALIVFGVLASFAFFGLAIGP